MEVAAFIPNESSVHGAGSRAGAGGGSSVRLGVAGGGTQRWWQKVKIEPAGQRPPQPGTRPALGLNPGAILGLGESLRRKVPRTLPEQGRGRKGGPREGRQGRCGSPRLGCALCGSWDASGGALGVLGFSTGERGRGQPASGGPVPAPPSSSSPGETSPTSSRKPPLLRWADPEGPPRRRPVCSGGSAPFWLCSGSPGGLLGEGGMWTE